MEKSKILEKLKEVIDPEIGYDIVALGEIDDIIINGKKVIVKLLPTTPLCPYLPVLIEQIEEKIKELGYEPEVEVVLDKQWTPDRIDPKIRKELGLE